MRFKYLVMVVVLGALGVVSGSQAAGGGNIFIGGGLAASDADGSFTDANALFSADESDTAFNIQIGVDINSWLQVHGGWMDLGKFDASALSLTSGSLTARTLDVDGFFGGVTMHYPLGHSGKLFVYGNLGIMAWDAEFRGGVFEGRDDGSEPYFGIGLGGKINDKFSWMGGFTRYQIDDIDVDAFGVNLLWYPHFANP